jgi:hypothetical protein
MEWDPKGKGRVAPFSPGASRQSAAADSDDDFQAIATGQRGAGMLAARDDRAIFFDGDAFSHQVQRLDQLAQGKRRRKTTGFAIDEQFNHRSLLLSGEHKFQYHAEFYPEAP